MTIGKEAWFRRAAKGEAFLRLAESPRDGLRLRPIQPSPCTQACPAGVNVKGYVGLIAAGRFQEALELVRRTNPFPAICGRVCHHPCESFCRRSEIDEPVAICWLKRFIADYEMSIPRRRVQPLPRTRPQRVAVIGSGPAGLTAASDLVHMGFSVTVFEAHDEAGGMLVLGIPEYRLPREVIQAEIQRILDFGVELRTGVRIGKDLNLRELLQKDGYSAAFVAIGAHLPRRLDIPGEEAEGLEDCLRFMRRVNSGEPIQPRPKVLVLGGGHSAIDCARSAVRLGCGEVHVAYRRSRAEMPAGESEVSQAEREGVRFTYLAAPRRVVLSGGKVKALELIRTRLGDPDSSGRRRPVEIAGSEFCLEADLILSAVGQKPDVEVGKKGSRLPTTSGGTVRVDPASLATSIEGVFAGGDAVTGPRTVIEAIAQGHKAAASIARFLDPKADFAFPGDASTTASWELEMGDVPSQKRPRTPMPQISASQRQQTFREVDVGFTQEMAIAEAQRCLRCGPCAECSLCVTACPKRQLMLTVNQGGLSWEALVRTNSNDPVLAHVSSEALARLNLESEWPPSSVGLDARLSDLACRVTGALCRGCGVCVENCGYGAIHLMPEVDGVRAAAVDAGICTGCGVCVALCPTGAIRPGYYTDAGLERRFADLDRSPGTVVFTCRWNPLAGRLSEELGPDIRTLPVLCAGRLNPALILKAFQRGARRVAAVTCAPDKCHYGFGSRVASESLWRARDLVALLGIDPSRYRVVTAADQLAEEDWLELIDNWREPRGEVANA